jgi:ABC-type oligopeptide transport system ATPase subunit
MDEANGQEKDYLLEVKNLKKYFPIQKGLLKKTVGYVKGRR